MRGALRRGAELRDADRARARVQIRRGRLAVRLREEVSELVHLVRHRELHDELAGAEETQREELRALARRPNLYQQLATALAPSVWELDDVKKGVLLQLFAEPFAPSRRIIECGNPETMQLVYRKLQGVRAEYAEQVTAQALAKLDAEANAAARSRT